MSYIMVYSEMWYIILYLFTKLINNQHLCTLPLYALCRTIFEPYFGSHKIRNSLMLKNMQKNFSGSHPLRFLAAPHPSHPFVSR